MDDDLIAVKSATTKLPELSVSDLPLNRHWHAHLSLDFAHENARSFLAKKRHTGPLVVQKTLHPEGAGVCHAIVIHPPGGVAGGDQLTLEARLDTKAQALLTTPGAGKWYKANGYLASQTLVFKLADQACLEWLPQENILFNGAQVRFAADVELTDQAVFAGWDIVCLGRQAQKERWQIGQLQQQLTIKRNHKLIWQERTNIAPEMSVMKSSVGLRDRVVFGNLVIAAGAVPQDILTACREITLNSVAAANAGEPPDYFGVTALPEIFSARYVGCSSQTARQYFEQLWHVLRPWYAGRNSIRPRIWNT